MCLKNEIHPQPKDVQQCMIELEFIFEKSRTALEEFRNKSKRQESTLMQSLQELTSLLTCHTASKKIAQRHIDTYAQKLTSFDSKIQLIGNTQNEIESIEKDLKSDEKEIVRIQKSLDKDTFERGIVEKMERVREFEKEASSISNEMRVYNLNAGQRAELDFKQKTLKEIQESLDSSYIQFFNLLTFSCLG